MTELLDELVKEFEQQKENAGELVHKPVILVIDDDALVRDLAEEILVEFGYKVITAIDGESGIQTYLENKEIISLIILDLMMPGMGGRRCLEEFLRIKPDIKVVIASGYSETERVKKAQQLGAGKYVKKPYTVQKIGLAVKAELERQQKAA